jgi:hypothetical protein
MFLREKTKDVCIQLANVVVERSEEYSIVEVLQSRSGGVRRCSVERPSELLLIRTHHTMSRGMER